MRRFILRLTSFIRSGRADAELSREVSSHLELLEDAYIAEGMSRDDARFAARRAFGGQVEQVKLRQRDARSFRTLDEFWLDIKLGVRMLGKYPGLTFVGGLGMAVAIAISTASFAFFYAYMYSPLPLDDGDRIVALENWDVDSSNEHRQAIHDFFSWRETMTTMEEIGAFRTIGRNLIVPGGTSEPVRLAEVTASAFRIARVAPTLGRPLLDEDEEPGAAPVIVIGHDVWQSRFASDPGVLGREIRLGTTVHTIVGVMPEGFLFPVNHSYWTPLRARPTDHRRGEGPDIFVFGRLASGVTMQEADAELNAIGLQAAAAFPETHSRLRPRVLPYAYPILDIQDVSVWQVSVMQFMMSILLVIVAVNIAVLVYARTATRQGEIAVRTALGASRGRIVGQLFVEALVLAAVSAAAGLTLANYGLAQAHSIMQMEGARPPYWIDYELPFAAIIYVVELAFVAAAIAGIVPALHATGGRVQSTLRQLGGGTGLQLGRTWTALIVGQVALAVAVLPLAVAVGWSEVRATTTTPVFDVEQILVAQFSMDTEPPAGADRDAYRAEIDGRFIAARADLISRLERESWVADATLARVPPGQEETARIEIERPGESESPSTYAVQVNHVEGDFFAAFDAPLLVGRRLMPEDVASVVVNRSFVERVLNGAHPVGRRVRYARADSDTAAAPEPWLEIVGMVADLHANAADPTLVRPAMFHALAPALADPVSLIVSVAGGTPASFAPRIREIMTAVDPTIRIEVYPLVEIYRQGNIAVRLVAAALSLVVVSVLLLSAAGIYALMSFTVSQRRREIGIRAALGADAQQLLRNIFARSATQLAAGILTGIAGAILIDAVSGGTLLGNEAVGVLPLMAALMLAVGLAAAAGPARRGLRIQPTQALREE